MIDIPVVFESPVKSSQPGRPRQTPQQALLSRRAAKSTLNKTLHSSQQPKRQTLGTLRRKKGLEMPAKIVVEAETVAAAQGAQGTAENIGEGNTIPGTILAAGNEISETSEGIAEVVSGEVSEQGAEATMTVAKKRKRLKLVRHAPMKRTKTGFSNALDQEPAVLPTVLSTIELPFIEEKKEEICGSGTGPEEAEGPTLLSTRRNRQASGQSSRSTQVESQSVNHIEENGEIDGQVRSEIENQPIITAEQEVVRRKARSKTSETQPVLSTAQNERTDVQGTTPSEAEQQPIPVTKVNEDVCKTISESSEVMDQPVAGSHNGHGPDIQDPKLNKVKDPPVKSTENSAETDMRRKGRKKLDGGMELQDESKSQHSRFFKNTTMLVKSLAQRTKIKVLKRKREPIGTHGEPQKPQHANEIQPAPGAINSSFAHIGTNHPRSISAEESSVTEPKKKMSASNRKLLKKSKKPQDNATMPLKRSKAVGLRPQLSNGVPGDPEEEEQPNQEYLPSVIVDNNDTDKSGDEPQPSLPTEIRDKQTKPRGRPKKSTSQPTLPTEASEKKIKRRGRRKRSPSPSTMLQTEHSDKPIKPRVHQEPEEEEQPIQENVPPVMVVNDDMNKSGSKPQPAPPTEISDKETKSRGRSKQFTSPPTPPTKAGENQTTCLGKRKRSPVQSATLQKEPGDTQIKPRGRPKKPRREPAPSAIETGDQPNIPRGNLAKPPPKTRPVKPKKSTQPSLKPLTRRRGRPQQNHIPPDPQRLTPPPAPTTFTDTDAAIADPLAHSPPSPVRPSPEPSTTTTMRPSPSARPRPLTAPTASQLNSRSAAAVAAATAAIGVHFSQDELAARLFATVPVFGPNAHLHSRLYEGGWVEEERVRKGREEEVFEGLVGELRGAVRRGWEMEMEMERQRERGTGKGMEGEGEGEGEGLVDVGGIMGA